LFVGGALVGVVTQTCRFAKANVLRMTYAADQSRRADSPRRDWRCHGPCACWARPVGQRPGAVRAPWKEARTALRRTKQSWFVSVAIWGMAGECPGGGRGRMGEKVRQVLRTGGREGCGPRWSARRRRWRPRRPLSGHGAEANGGARRAICGENGLHRRSNPRN
jgi:hypothetical protein